MRNSLIQKINEDVLSEIGDIKESKTNCNRDKIRKMVRKERLELSRPKALEPKSSVYTNFTTSASGVDDGARTHDNRNHNPGLYQLSYAHQS